MHTTYHITWHHVTPHLATPRHTTYVAQIHARMHAYARACINAHIYVSTCIANTYDGVSLEEQLSVPPVRHAKK